MLIPSEHDGAVDLVWSREHARRAGRHLVINLASGEQRVRSPTLARFLASVRKNDARVFVSEVAKLVRDAPVSAEVREAVDRFGGTYMARPNGERIGDVDVLAVQRDSRVVTLFECKDITQGNLPGDARREFGILEEAVDVPKNGKHG